jgi:hypothetical protein
MVLSKPLRGRVWSPMPHKPPMPARKTLIGHENDQRVVVQIVLAERVHHATKRHHPRR